MFTIVTLEGFDIVPILGDIVGTWFGYSTQ